MPSVNRKKEYVRNAYYHIYNRGVEKRRIFLQRADYLYYLRIWREAVENPREVVERLSKNKKSYVRLQNYLNRKSHYNRIKIAAYALMPNHFHILIKQIDARAIELFMKSVQTRYTLYFNKRYDRVGPLCQDIYKARYLKKDNDVVELSQYIHRNPLALTNNLEKYPWSSYPIYLGKKSKSWVYCKEVKSKFKKYASVKGYTGYSDFTEDQR